MPMTVWESVLAGIAELAGSHQALCARIDQLDLKLDQVLAKENKLSDQQAELDTDAQTLIGVVNGVNASVQTALTEVAALQAAIANGTPAPLLDFSVLETALGSAQTAATGVASVATAAAPAAPPAPSGP